MNNHVFSDVEYGKVLDNFVIGCIDVAILYGGAILLERRSNDPIMGEWWIFGGRMRVGEAFKETAARSVVREVDLEINPERFFEVGVYNLRWLRRREPKPSNGCHHLLVAHAVDINKSEYDSVNKNIMKSRLNAEWHSYDKILSEEYLHEIKDIVSKLSNHR